MQKPSGVSVLARAASGRGAPPLLLRAGVLPSIKAAAHVLHRKTIVTYHLRPVKAAGTPGQPAESIAPVRLHRQHIPSRPLRRIPCYWACNLSGYSCTAL